MATNITPTGSEPADARPRSPFRYVTLGARLLLGLIFFVFGLNGFLHFIPQPKTPMPEGVIAFMGGLVKTGYMLPLIMGTQLLSGVLLLVNRFVPLSLALLAPVIVNIILFHVFLQPTGIPPGAVACVLEIYLAWTYRKSYGPMLRMRTSPEP